MRACRLLRCNKSLTGGELAVESRVCDKSRQQALERIPEPTAVDRLVDKFVSKPSGRVRYRTLVTRKPSS